MKNPISCQRFILIPLPVLVFCLACGGPENPVGADQTTAMVDSTSPTGLAGLDAEQLFDTSRIMEVRIEIEDKKWDKLRNQSRSFFDFITGADSGRPYTYFRGTVWVNGVRIGNVGIRKKGLFGSQDTDRPSLKIKFDEYVDQAPVRGLNRLTLNNNKQDTSQFSQILTYELFRKAGVRAPRSSFAHVTVNGKNLGVYTHVESVKKPFLKRAFGNDRGNLYEGTVADFYPHAVSGLEAKTNRKSDRAHIRKLAEVLSGSELDLETLETLVDLDHYFRFWAIEGLVRFWDGYSANQNNYFFYVNPENNLGYFIPWGADASFLANGGPFNNNRKWTCIYANSYLSNRLFHHPGMAERYRKQMQFVLHNVWDADHLIDRMESLRPLLDGKLHSSQKGTDRAIEQVQKFIRQRRAVIEKELADWKPDVPERPRKPSYEVPLGKLSGSFDTTWHDKRPRNPTAVGSVRLNLVLNGEPVTFAQTGGVAQKYRLPTFGARRLNPDPPAEILLAGLRKSDGKRITMSIYIDMSDYTKQKTGRFEASGIMVDGRGGSFSMFGGKRATRTLRGSVDLERSGSKPGATVRGRIDMEIIEMRGGLFQR